MSSNPLNDLSKVYIDQIANVRKAETEADIQRWEEIGGPTPTNYKPTGNSAKIKTEEKIFKSNWRVELNDDYQGDPSASIPVFPGGEKQAAKKVKDVKGIKNKIEINPKLPEAVEQMGGELIEATEVDPIILSAVDYFYEEGINEEGLELLIEEIGLEAFVDFVEGGAVELNEARDARRATVRAKKYDVVKKEVDKADAARRASKKGEYAPSYAKKETDVTVYDDKPAAKKKVVAKKPAAPKKPDAPAKPAVPKKPAVPAKPAVPKKPVAKKVVKAVAKVKKAQPVKKPSKAALTDRIRSAYKAGVKRHRKATQVPRVFAKGAVAGAKKTVRFVKDVKKAVVGEATDAQLKAQEKGVFELEKREANADRAKAKKARAKELGEDYETQKKKEVLTALKKRTLKKSVKDKIAADIVRRKGDTSKSDDRYAYEEFSDWRDELLNEVEVSKLDDKRSKAAREAMLQALEQQAVKKKKQLAKEENDPAREHLIQRKQLMLDRQKLKLRMKAQAAARKSVLKDKEQKQDSSSLDAQANVIASESRDRALELVRQDIIKKHGKGAIYDPKRDAPTEADKKKAAAERQKRQAEKNKAFADRAKKAGYKNPQDYANVVARYGSEDNMKKGRGLGT